MVLIGNITQVGGQFYCSLAGSLKMSGDCKYTKDQHTPIDRVCVYLHPQHS